MLDRMAAEGAVEKGVSATKSFLKNHWLAFLVVALVIVILAFAYDAKNSGKLRTTFAGWPIVGKLFACFAFVWALQGQHIVHLLSRVA